MIVSICVIKVEKRVSSCLLEFALFDIFLIRLMAETSPVSFLEVRREIHISPKFSWLFLTENIVYSQLFLLIYSIHALSPFQTMAALNKCQTY